MKLNYTKQDGSTTAFELGERSITIGRSPDADIILLDDKVSRVHCGIRLWDGECYVKDLKSKNGTFVNEHRVEMAKLKPGDTVRIGSYSFTFDVDPVTGTDTALREIGDKMSGGKGYGTLLKEIVHDSEEPVPEVEAQPTVQATPAGTKKPVIKIGKKVMKVQQPADADVKTAKLPGKKPIKIKIKRPSS